MAFRSPYLYTDKRPKQSGFQITRRVLSYFAPFRWPLLLAVACIAINAACASSIPLFTRAIIDHAIPQKSLRLAALIMLAYVGAMGVKMVVWYLGQSQLFYMRERVIFRLRSDVFSHLQHLCLRFHHRYNPGFLYDRTLGNASNSISLFLTMLFSSLVFNGTVLVSALIFSFTTHAGMASVMLVMSVCYILVGRKFGMKIHRLSSDLNSASNVLAGQITDLLRGIKTIKAFAIEDRVVREFDEQLWPLHLRSIKISKATILLTYIGEAVGYLITVTITLLCALLVMRTNGHFTIGDLVLFMAYQSTVNNMLLNLTAAAGAYGAALAGAEQLFEVLDETPTVVEQPHAVMPAEVRGEITFDAVHFAYDEQPVIRDFSVRVEPGQRVALVGPSGGGKSTVINLLLRFYDPAQGTIRLDGRDIRELPLASYRSLFGVVLQDPFLFNDSIYNNLRAVAPDADDMAIRRALERAQAWEFVEKLDNGWDYNVGESGGQLSGGQRQRIALARCFLANPRIMVLDEATSALDTQSEWLVQQALEDIMRDRNVFVIAHRLSTVRCVDRILVIEDGRIVQDGSYDELSRVPGPFHTLLTFGADQIDDTRYPTAS